MVENAPRGLVTRLPALLGRALIFLYRATFSAIAGRGCRYLPTCSEYADEAIARHGLWAGSWMGLARLCRCRPGGGDGFDPPPTAPSPGAGPLTPWRYGEWRRPSRCDAPGGGSGSGSGGAERESVHDFAINSKARP